MKLVSRALALVIVSCLAPCDASASSPLQLPSGQCDVTVVQGNILAKPACSANPPSQYLAVTTSTYNPWLGITTTAYQAVRSDWGTPLVPVDVWNMCRYISNNSPGSGLSIFVPFKGHKEWQNFVAAAGSTSLPYISLSTCSVPWLPPTPNADTQAGDPQYCGSPGLLSPPPPLPYAPTNASLQQSTAAQYNCTCADGTTQWKQAATVTYSAGDSDNNAPQGGWSQTTPNNCTGSLINNVCYTGAVPQGCSGGDGQCGPANGVASQNPPSGNSNLCTSGTPSAVTQNGSNWVWTCDGSGGGTNASCSAPLAVCPAEQVQDTGWFCPIVTENDYQQHCITDPSTGQTQDGAPCQAVNFCAEQNVEWGSTSSMVIKTNLPDGYLNQNVTAIQYGPQDYQNSYHNGLQDYFLWGNTAVFYTCTSSGWQRGTGSGGGGGCCPSCCCGPTCHIVSE